MEKPILFNSEMVCAILDNRKTQTRRVIKPQPICPQLEQHGFYDVTRGELLCCPYAENVGDLLWVREAHAIVPRTAYAASRDDDGQPLPHRVSPDGADWAIYREGWDRCKPCRWRPSIHMPRWASRLTLEVTGVRVERVQSISHEDALAEGVVAFTVSPGTAPASYPITFYSPGPHDEGGYPQAREAFENLWDSINAKRGYGWDVNPWVWVVEFGRA